ncbi:MAG: D-alanyl-D-alanine carboxypeptidase [Eubacterium sp.]|nr:D-alanyl-D-alanine carboxypeptidase [Eubacterium sp.]
MKKMVLILRSVFAVAVLAAIIFAALNNSEITAKSIFYCVDTDKVIYSNGADERIAPASLTKLLTASVALYYINPDEVFTVGSEQELVPTESSLCLILPGHQLTLYDLITGMLMASGNDAAYTVAVSTARILNPGASMTDQQAVDYFCGLMNDFAERLGMHNSHFVTPDGSDNHDQYTTVSDLLLLSEYALSVPEIREITGTYQKYVVFESGENITWTNSNKLLCPDSGLYCEYAIGMKTGTTTDAGNCLIAAFEKDDKTFISVVADCLTDYDRYEVTLRNFSTYV